MALLISCQLFLLLLLSISLLLAFLHLTTRKLQKKNLPPGPRQLPVVGNLHQLGSAPHRSLRALAMRHGPLMFLRLGSVPTLVISSGEVVREVTKTHDITLSGRPALYAAKRFSYDLHDMVFAPYGEVWRQLRKVSIVELLSVKRVQSFTSLREEEVASMVASISHSSASNQPIDLSKMLLKLANNVTCKIVFGTMYHGDQSKVQEMLAETQDVLGGFCIADFYPSLQWTAKFTGLEARLERNFRELDEFYDRMIDEHLTTAREQRSPEREDLVDVLLRLRADPDYKEIFSNMNHIKGLLTDMFIAGTDTSSASLVWTMTELIRNPRTMAKIQQEIRDVVKNNNSPIIQEHHLQDLNYLKLVVKESLRLHPPAPLLVPRETLEECTINGYKVPAKTRVFINAQAIAMDPETWEHPEKFWPDRFYGSDINFLGQDFSMVPFGFGRRICPGANFSTVLVELVLANLLYNFKWELPLGTRAEDINMDEAFGITMHKKESLCLVALPN